MAWWRCQVIFGISVASFVLLAIGVTPSATYHVTARMYHIDSISNSKQSHTVKKYKNPTKQTQEGSGAVRKRKSPGNAKVISIHARTTQKTSKKDVNRAHKDERKCSTAHDSKKHNPMKHHSGSKKLTKQQKIDRMNDYYNIRKQVVKNNNNNNNNDIKNSKSYFGKVTSSHDDLTMYLKDLENSLAGTNEGIPQQHGNGDAVIEADLGLVPENKTIVNKYKGQETTIKGADGKYRSHQGLATITIKEGDQKEAFPDETTKVDGQRENGKVKDKGEAVKKQREKTKEKEKEKDEDEVEHFYEDELEKEYTQFKQEVKKDNAITNEKEHFKTEPGGFRITLGDMALPKEQEKELLETPDDTIISHNPDNTTITHHKMKSTVVDVHKEWTMPVPYIIADDIKFESSGKTRNAIELALKEIQDKSCVTFKHWSGEKAYLKFLKGVGSQEGCWSFVGRQPQQPQIVSISKGCEFKSIAVHEVMHALGFFHEQNRPDRDSHIHVNMNNVQPRFTENFRKKSQSDTSNTPYDFTSVMHYPLTAFGILVDNKKQATMEPLGKSPLQVSQPINGGLSPYDIVELKKLYNCGESQQKQKKAPKPVETFNNVKIPREYMISADLLYKLEIFMESYEHQNHYKFTVQLRNYLFIEYPAHFFTVLTYNSVAAARTDSQAFVGYCVHKYNYHGRNCVVCHSSKKSKFLSKQSEVNIWKKILHSAEDRNTCHATNVRIDGWKAALAEQKNHHVMIALVFVLRSGNDLVFTNPGHLYHKNFNCQKGTQRSAQLLILFGEA